MKFYIHGPPKMNCDLLKAATAVLSYLICFESSQNIPIFNKIHFNNNTQKAASSIKTTHIIVYTEWTGGTSTA